MVLVEDHQVPVNGVNPLVLRLDQPGLLVPTQQVLEGTEIHQRLIWVTRSELSHEIGVAVLPAVEIHMAGQIFVPRVLHGRLEGHHQDPLGSHAPSELIRGEGLAKTHLRVPQESRHCGRIFLPDRLEIADGLVYRTRLLRSHREGLVVVAREYLTSAKFRDCREYINRLAPHPLGRRAKVRVLKAFSLQSLNDVLVAEDRAIFTLCHHVSVKRELLLDLALGLADPLAHVLPSGLADLNETLILRRGVLRRPRVNPQPRRWTRRKQYLRRVIHHSSSIGRTIDSMKAISSSVSPYLAYNSSSVQVRSHDCWGINA